MDLPSADQAGNELTFSLLVICFCCESARSIVKIWDTLFFSETKARMPVPPPIGVAVKMGEGSTVGGMGVRVGGITVKVGVAAMVKVISGLGVSITSGELAKGSDPCPANCCPSSTTPTSKNSTAATHRYVRRAD